MAFPSFLVLGAQKAGNYDVTIEVEGQRFEKTLVVANHLERLSPIRYQGGFWNKLLHPTESLIEAAAPVREITVRYPPTELSVLGWEMHWIYAYFVLSLLFAFPLRGVFGVEV